MRNFTIAVGSFAIAAMFALGPAKADTIISDGKCWVNDNQTNYHWGACQKETRNAKRHHKESTTPSPTSGHPGWF